MTLTTYKGYTIRTVGLSQHIYRPGTFVPGTAIYLPGYEQSMAAAKRWINQDLKGQGKVTWHTSDGNESRLDGQRNSLAKVLPLK